MRSAVEEKSLKRRGDLARPGAMGTGHSTPCLSPEESQSDLTLSALTKQMGPQPPENPGGAEFEEEQSGIPILTNQRAL